MKSITRIIRVSLFTNFFLAIIKFVFGLLGKSSALVADGIHSFSDLSTDLVALFGNRLASKPADEKHPFGHGKLEYLTSLVIGVVVIWVGLSLIWNLSSSGVIVPSFYVVIVSTITIFIKYLLSHYLIKYGKKYDNTILIASGKESSSDVVSSIIVLISSVCMQFSHIFPILKYTDMVASIIVGIFIVCIGFNLVKENISFIIGEQITDEDVLLKLKEVILSDSEVKGIDSLVILKFGYFCSITCDVVMSGELSLLEAHKVVDDIEKQIKNMDDKYRYITIHINPI